MSERRRDAEFVAQPGLFDSPVLHTAISDRDVVTANQITRTSHPDTSRIAAERLIATSKRTRDADDAMELVRKFPGLTGYELDAKVGERMSRRISRRLGDLKNQGRVINGDARICEQCEATCVTWYPNTK